MKLRILVLLLLSHATNLSADNLFFGTVGSGEVEYEFLAPRAIVNFPPAWDGKSDAIPLSMQKAIQILQDAAREDFGMLPPLRSIGLTQNYLNKVYHYEASFIVPDVSDPRSHYILLLDGTVVRVSQKSTE